MKKYLVCLLALGLLLVNCKKDDDGLDPSGPDPDPQADVQAQDFIWKATNLYYFWQQDVPNLADDRFATSAEYTEFLLSESDPGDLFDNKLRFRDDRFTFYSSDYRKLTQSLGGVTFNNGLEFGLSFFSDSEDIYGYVYYVLPESDASTKDIKRGELFTGVNGQSLNLGNYEELLFGDKATYTLNMASLENNTITPNGKEVELTKQAGFQEKPIFLEKIIESNGKKIGYLMYNRFLGSFDGELNEVFGRFEAEGITDLILDFRYNPGGSVLASQRIASMVYNNDPKLLFSTSVTNEKYRKAVYPESNPNGERYFQNRVIVTNQDDEELYNEVLKTLNLDKVYIIALRSSASASELVINSLAPYMDVIHVGDTTRGKNEFSNTFVDVPSNGYFYHSSIVDKINPDNSWAIQPLTGRSANADGFFEYTSGLIPDITLEESLSNFGVLGDPSEPLLARAIQSITGESSKQSFDQSMPINDLTNSRIQTPIKDNMYEGDVLLPSVIEK